ncbi:hypothetical protein PL321_05085 [Caloramator sp. mosi_1]|uniref:alpha/beta fold hydrolase n=1 Tax=Caloramator sp. mosi_1 TaxID=3023090 RepID=UPI00235E4A58|nr:hypothetical protein [Caloramator sp. mosi_1]WDC84934.1 hypothetical protein PL321_05085 [Caloramator sp. mosi_1]
MGKVELKKVNLKNGEVMGYREGGEGKTILLVHGNMVSSRHWENFLSAWQTTITLLQLI